MCTGLEIASLIAGPVLSAAGGAIQRNEAQENAERMAEARNKRLNMTLAKNDALAEKSRDEFNQRQQNATKDKIDESQEQKTEQRQDTLEQAITPAEDAVADVSLSGSAPTVVRSELAKKMADVMGESKANAQRLATLGGYGDTWLDQGFQDVDAGRGINTNANFAQGNMSILPYQQDIAEQRAYKPISPLGGLLQGFGSAVSSYGGGMGVPKTSYKDPWAGMRQGYI